MGDRFVIGLRNSKDAPTMYLYSHWGGDEQESTLAEALRVVLEEQRQDDYDYANRIVVSQIVGTQWDKPLGYGLSIGAYADPDYSYINVVDWSEGKVYRSTDGAEDEGTHLATFIAKTYVDDRERM